MLLTIDIPGGNPEAVIIKLSVQVVENSKATGVISYEAVTVCEIEPLDNPPVILHSIVSVTVPVIGSEASSYVSSFSVLYE